MKFQWIFLLAVCGLAGFLLTAGCITPAAKEVTPLSTSGNIVKIANIFENPETYNGTTVLISGKVANQCGSGCWFFLDDGTATIYVDLLPNNFAIPPMLGSKVTVKGTIRVDGKDVSMVGTTVITDLQVYP
jgi:uncharacterized protein YdeI (BOF family)